MILNDKKILEQVDIYNGVTTKVQKGTKTWRDMVVESSYGIDPQGYTFRLKADEDVAVRGGQCVQVDSYERFDLPNNICGFLYGKSSFTRRGLIFSFAVVDAGYNGGIGFSVFNGTNNTIILPAMQGIAQIVFHQIEEPDKGYEGVWQGYGLNVEVLGDK